MENTKNIIIISVICIMGKQKESFLHPACFYLNRTAYSGMSRYNSKGEFNAPFGNYKNYHPWDFITEEAINLLKS